jgi:hypothetical protein
LREILDPKGEFYHDGHINREYPSTLWGANIWTINMTCAFVTISKRDV